MNGILVVHPLLKDEQGLEAVRAVLEDGLSIDRQSFWQRVVAKNQSLQPFVDLGARLEAQMLSESIPTHTRLFDKNKRRKDEPSLSLEESPQ